MHRFSELSPKSDTPGKGGAVFTLLIKIKYLIFAVLQGQIVEKRNTEEVVVSTARPYR